ncbi:MAG TPA: thiol reductant ABC exporter subunit CydC [Nitrolancea sp.]|nr:thiol reductant ABC exporter subunit CydC [Nitrolancea sp.]
MRTLTRLLGFLSPYRWRIALAIFLGVLTVATNTGLLATAAYLISAAATHPLLIELTAAIYLVRIFGISRAFVRYAERIVSHNVTFKLLGSLRTRLYRKLEPLAPARLADYRSGDLLARMIRDIEELQNLFQQVAGPALVALASSIATVVAFAVFSDVLAVVALAFLVLTGVGIPLLARYLGRDAGRRELTVRAELNAQLIDGVQGVQDLLALGRDGDHRQRIARLSDELSRLQRRMARITGMQQCLSDLSTNLALWTILLFAIPMVHDAQIRGVYLATLGLIMLGSFEAVRPLGRSFQFLERTVAAGERIFEIADSEPLVVDPAVPCASPESALLEFRDVSFSYGPNESLILDQINFTVQPDSRVAIVGPSGAGKSTIANLIVRFWDPISGEIRLGQHDLRDYAQEQLRGQIGLVGQNTRLFTSTLRANARLGKPNATDDEIEAVLRRAQLDELLQRLPEGINTWLGEQGMRFSGGERQRLAIARVLLKDAPLLILDEPTANLDPLTERDLLDALLELFQDRSLLLITHRLVRLEQMDEILVLDGGRIVERGTHVELAHAGGLYQRMLEVQDQVFALA